MDIESLKLVCFSPTGTTKKVLRAIAEGFNNKNAELVDITTADARKKELQISEDEVLLVGVPVYMGRVPAFVSDWLNTIKANKTIAVCVVVYGNREYDDALLELKDILKSRGCVSIAGAAYIGEHSFSSMKTPTAHGRPDENDLSHAKLFGSKINEKLLAAISFDQLSEVELPGNYPYGGLTQLWSVDFIAVSDECTQCGLCAQTCPVDAINPEDSGIIDQGKCITCCACIKTCPQEAKSMKDSQVKDAALRLNSLYKERKEPVFFL